MAVIINEFEVVPEPTQQPEVDAQTEQQPAAAQNLLPQQVDSVLRLLQQRNNRVRDD